MTSTLFRRATTVALLLGAIVITFVVVPTAALATDVVGLSDPGALVVHEGTIEVRENDTVIRDLEIRGTLRIEAENVRVCNVWVYTSAPWTIYVASGSAEFQNVEIGNPDVVGERGIGGSNLRATNIDIHSVEDGIKLGSNATYSHIWIHDLDSASDEPHIDAVQADGGAQNSSISHSVLSSVGPRGLGNAAVFLKSDKGPIANVSITNNLLNGGNYMNAVRDGGEGAPQGIRFVDNQIGDDYRYGISRLQGEVTWDANTWASTGAPAEPGTTNETAASGAPVETVPPEPTGEPSICDDEQPMDTTTSSTSSTEAPVDTTDALPVSASGDTGDSPSGIGSVQLAVLVIATTAVGVVAGVSWFLWSRRSS